MKALGCDQFGPGGEEENPAHRADTQPTKPASIPLSPTAIPTDLFLATAGTHRGAVSVRTAPRLSSLDNAAPRESRPRSMTGTDAQLARSQATISIAVYGSEAGMGTVSTVANVFAALGTVFAVILALFLQVILVQRRRPSLYLDYSSDEDDQDSIALDLEHDLNFWVQMKVRSRARKNTAHNVEVTLLRVVRPAGANRAAVPSRVLKWSDALSLRVDIPSGIWKRVDIIHYWSEKEGAKRSLLLPAFNRQVVGGFPPSQRHYLTDAGEYRFELIVSADDIDASAWWVSFWFEPQQISSLMDMRQQIKDVRFGRAKIDSQGRFIY